MRVVLITLDTLRYDSFAGTSERSTTMPRLRRWAENATVFERFFSASASTQPSHAAMFTGLHPWENGVTGNSMRLEEAQVTVAEQLRSEGFATAAVVASFPVSARLGFAQGFVHFDDRFDKGQIRGEWSSADSEVGEDEGFYNLADLVTERAVEQLDTATAERQFFWFHFFDPHDPYGDTVGGETIGPHEILRPAARGEDPGPELERARRLYDADVAFLDKALSRLLERLDAENGLWETHIVVAADHGESFGEDGSVAHGRRLIPSQIHVPLIIRSPRLPAGVRRDITGSIDVAATLTALAAGGDPPAAHAGPLSGRDLTRPVVGPTRAYGMRRTYREPFRDHRLDGSVTSIEGFLFFVIDEHGALYRGNRDFVMPYAAPILTEEEARRVRAIFSGFQDEAAQLLREDQVVDPEVEKGLRALGYVS